MPTLTPTNQRKKSKQRVGDYWETPEQLLIAVENTLGISFTLDVCAVSDNAKCFDFFDEKKTDALSEDWYSRFGTTVSEAEDGRIPCAWMNPPFSKMSTWFGKAFHETNNGRFPLVGLAPCDCSTKWFQEFAFRAEFLVFLSPRIKFIPPAWYTEPCSGSQIGACLFLTGFSKTPLPLLHGKMKRQTQRTLYLQWAEERLRVP